MDQGPKSYWAEFLGTFTLCFIGQGAICAQFLMQNGPGSLLPIAIAYGLALAVMISALGAASGGHFNPAVTLGFVVTGRQSLTSAITYWLSQILGAVVASFLLRSIVPADVVAGTHLGAPGVAPEISLSSAFLLEFVLTFLVVTVYWGTAVDEAAPRLGGIAVGLAAAMGVLMGGRLTGAAMNPARAFGPALATATWGGQWVYWAGPLAGGAVAALVHKNLVLRRH